MCVRVRARAAMFFERKLERHHHGWARSMCDFAFDPYFNQVEFNSCNGNDDLRYYWVSLPVISARGLMDVRTLRRGDGVLTCCSYEALADELPADAGVAEWRALCEKKGFVHAHAISGHTPQPSEIASQLRHRLSDCEVM